jgi:hypothetical protein
MVVIRAFLLICLLAVVTAGQQAVPLRDIEERLHRRQYKLSSDAPLPQMGAATRLRFSQGEPGQRAAVQHELSARFNAAGQRQARE